jgi:hypothetical protein
VNLTSRSYRPLCKLYDTVLKALELKLAKQADLDNATFQEISADFPLPPTDAVYVRNWDRIDIVT